MLGDASRGRKDKGRMKESITWKMLKISVLLCSLLYHDHHCDPHEMILVCRYAAINMIMIISVFLIMTSMMTMTLTKWYQYAGMQRTNSASPLTPYREPPHPPFQTSSSSSVSSMLRSTFCYGQPPFNCPSLHQQLIVRFGFFHQMVLFFHQVEQN